MAESFLFADEIESLVVVVAVVAVVVAVVVVVVVCLAAVAVDRALVKVVLVVAVVVAGVVVVVGAALCSDSGLFFQSIARKSSSSQAGRPRNEF